MGRRRRPDPDELLDQAQVATHMGLAGADALIVYIRRFDDFPEPWVARGRYCKLWLPEDIDAFLKRHPGLGRKRPRDDVAPPS